MVPTIEHSKLNFDWNYHIYNCGLVFLGDSANCLISLLTSNLNMLSLLEGIYILCARARVCVFVVFHWNSVLVTLILLYHSNGPLTRCAKLWVAHAPGMPGTFSLPPRVSDPDMHHGTCATHVGWCMSGSLTSSFLWSRLAGKTFLAFPAHA